MPDINFLVSVSLL